MSFRVAGARDCAPCQKSPKREGFVAFPKTGMEKGIMSCACQCPNYMTSQGFKNRLPSSSCSVSARTHMYSVLGLILSDPQAM